MGVHSDLAVAGPGKAADACKDINSDSLAKKETSEITLDIPWLLVSALVVALAISLSFINSAYANVLQLKYKIERKIENSAGTSNKSVEPAQQTSCVQTLDLDRNAFAISPNEEKSTQFDFEKRRIRYLDHRAHTMRDVSLYLIVCNSDMTMQRNYLIRKQLGNMKQSFQTNVDPFTLSCITGLPYPDNSDAEISVEEKDKTVVFIHKGRVITTVTFSDTPLPESFANSYDKAVLYELELHPMVRKQIADRKKLIEKLSYTVQLLGGEDSSSTQTRTTTMQLVGTAEGANSVSAPVNYKLTFSPESPSLNSRRRYFCENIQSNCWRATE
jgi:hypothetical protein